MDSRPGGTTAVTKELPANAATPAHVTQRGCDVCGAVAGTRLYRQRFAEFDDRSAFECYDVVACERCGFVYADGIPGQDVFDRYYRTMSKYESHDRGGAPSEAAQTNYRSIAAELAARFPAREARVLDVGSGSGHLLAALREAGFAHVEGFDPSPRCSELARERYGIEVANTPISTMRLDGQRFDLVLLSSVLEHLRDLGPTVRELGELVAPGGAMWFEVPDAERFADFVVAPFQQFSLEHINFFTATSLRSLMARAGLVAQHVWTADRLLGAVADPALDALFVRTAHDGAFEADLHGARRVRAYVELSEAVEERILRQIEPLSASQAPVAVFGTGSLTLHLLANERFRRLRITAFVDSNANYHGKTIGGIPVIAPAALAGRPETIVIVSAVYEREIAETIRARHALPNPLVRLFDTASAA